MRPINLPAYGKVGGMPTLSEDLIFRGLIHQMTDTDLPKRFDQPGLTVYAGFDPSADSLHVGNLMQLCTLRRFQEAGHRPISLAGGGTGMIGDPGGKQDERQLLDLETIEGYLRAIRPQLGQFLDLTEGRGLLLDNADWLTKLSTLEYLRDVGKHFTVNQMVAKEHRQEPPRPSGRRGSPTRSSATCCSRPTTSSGCTSTMVATCQLAGATSGATSPWASTTSAGCAATKSGASPLR